MVRLTPRRGSSVGGSPVQPAPPGAGGVQPTAEEPSVRIVVKLPADRAGNESSRDPVARTAAAVAAAAAGLGPTAFQCRMAMSRIMLNISGGLQHLCDGVDTMRLTEAMRR